MGFALIQVAAMMGAVLSVVGCRFACAVGLVVGVALLFGCLGVDLIVMFVCF